MRLPDIEIIYADKEDSVKSPRKSYVAVYHGLTRIYSRKLNIERIKVIAKIARAKRARALILPAYFNTGPIIEFSDLSQRKYMLRLFEQVSDTTIDSLRGIALSERIDILVSSFLEKAGAHHYISSLMILKDGSIGGRYRKILLSEKEDLYGVKSGKKIVVFNTSKINYGVVINDEIMVPELCRGLKALGANIIVVPVNPLGFKYKMAYIVGRVRALENDIAVLFVGGVIEHHDKIVSAAPTVLISNAGDPLFEYNENKPALIFFDIDTLAKESAGILDVLTIYHINKIVFSELKKLQRELKEKLYSQLHTQKEEES
ncbi:carbon-nitrogen hydrolase family protein [Desulfurococcaceae archaeon MEX13E-LK6-19]|nr:carbon-nitrogen hydrolase family protein [Desulfurococcaceae archaeon MEX13E-LK6-19]